MASWVSSLVSQALVGVAVTATAQALLLRDVVEMAASPADQVAALVQAICQAAGSSSVSVVVTLPMVLP